MHSAMRNELINFIQKAESFDAIKEKVIEMEEEEYKRKQNKELCYRVYRIPEHELLDCVSAYIHPTRLSDDVEVLTIINQGDKFFIVVISEHFTRMDDPFFSVPVLSIDALAYKPA